MDNLEKLAQGLTDEAMTDMAENFFGCRKGLDDDLERLKDLAEDLKAIGRNLSGALLPLWKLLGGAEGVDRLFDHLGLPGPMNPPGRESFESDKGLPWAFTSGARFVKYLEWAYDYYQDGADEYINGRYGRDSENPERKRLSLNYRSMSKYVRKLNEKIEKVNNQCNPVCVLQYAKSLDPEAEQKDRVTGATLVGYACSLEEKFAYDHVDFDSLGLDLFQEVPPLGEVREGLRAFARTWFKDNSRQARGGMDALKRAMRPRTRSKNGTEAPTGS